jgi:mRNA interferase RelE/StbE
VFRIELLPSAARTLRELAVADQRRIVRRIDVLADDPRPSGARKLRGSDDVWRICVGEYRVLYRIEDERLVILVVKVGHRREVYRP